MCVNMCIVQGPPGTGKSYIGLQLLRLFLSMKRSSGGRPVLDKRPALVMAYKNRALDLFIKTYCDFCPEPCLEGIVRIGHLSSDNEEELKCTLLGERVKKSIDRSHHQRVRYALRQKYKM